MTKTEMLFRRAAQIADGGSTASGIAAQIGALDRKKRLATYRDALETAKDQDPPCPDCWLGHGEDLAMAHISTDWPEEHLYGCMICGFEESFPVKAVRTARRKSSTGRAARAA